ncbi:MAG: hypothetical protein ACRENW_01865 [Thermodesulfobacteriota bacterium]
MKNKFKSLLIPIFLGGAWGVFTYLIGSLISSGFSLASFLFYPILFGGVTVIIACTFGSKIPFVRAITVGLISGLIYHILSPISPFLTSVLVGAGLGGGLAAEEGKFKDVFNRLISVLKGIFFFPIFIYVGGLLAGLTSSIFGSNFIIWFFWGGWLSLGICIIYMPLLKEADSGEDFETLSEADEFTSETHEILRELRQLDSRFK